MEGQFYELYSSKTGNSLRLCAKVSLGVGALALVSSIIAAFAVGFFPLFLYGAFILFGCYVVSSILNGVALMSDNAEMNLLNDAVAKNRMAIDRTPDPVSEYEKTLGRASDDSDDDF